jgi:ferredoxin-thioredoxin reductase catalytic subunit
MNERIKELAEKAGFYANPDIEKFEKFAELLLQEATDIVYRMLDNNTGAEVVVAVKEHFGVE